MISRAIVPSASLRSSAHCSSFWNSASAKRTTTRLRWSSSEGRRGRPTPGRDPSRPVLCI